MDRGGNFAAWNTAAPLGGSGSTLAQEEWSRWIGEIAAEGWRLVQCEFRHNRFDTDDGGRPRQSQFYVSGHLTNALHPDRLVVEGNMVVDWAPTVQGQPASIERVDVSSFSVKRRQGPPPFEAVLIQRTPLARGKYSLGPLILYDLDGDGISEMILPSENRVYAKLGSSGSESHPLFQVQPRSLTAAVIADFDGDGLADVLGASGSDLVLFRGADGGRFEEVGRRAWTSLVPLEYPMVLTCGDVDADGDLDVFLGQYKLPYRRRSDARAPL